MRLLTTLKKFVAPRPATRPDDAREREREQYSERMKPLGELRCRVLMCMMADDPKSANYFAPPLSSDLGDAFLRFLQDHCNQRLPGATGPQFNGMAIVAAGVLTYGRLDMADYVLANLPPHRVQMDMFAGWCNVLAFRIAATLLPLPERLRAYIEWYEGSPTANEVRQWFATHRPRLEWDAAQQKFQLAPVPKRSI